MSEAAYNIGWENLNGRSKEIQPYLIMLMKRAQEPLILTLAGFADLGLDLFLSTAKATYSYFTFLSRFKQN